MIEARIIKHYAARRDSAAFTLDIELNAAGGVTALFGPSGAGKTLTLDCIAGFANPDSGRILLEDRIVFDAEARVKLRPQDRRCGYVFQNYALFPHMTLRQNLMFAAARQPRLERQRRVNDILERFRIADVAGRKPHELSGGQKQRCSIARALVGGPRLLLLDEPARGLDAPLREELYDVLRQVREEFDLPVLLVTHDLDECLELASEMLILRDGKVVQSGSPAHVCAQPASLDVARLLGRFNIIPAEIRTLDPSRNESILRIDDFEVRSEYYPGHLKGDKVHLLVTPSQLRAVPSFGRPGPNQIPAALTRIIDAADRLRLEFEGGVLVETPSAGFDRHNRDWVVEFPARGMRIL